MFIFKISLFKAYAIWRLISRVLRKNKQRKRR